MFKIIISTKSKTAQIVFQLKTAEEIIIQPGKNNSKTGWISPTTQQLFQFAGHLENQVLLKVTANQVNPVCSIVSVQPLEN